MALEIERKFLVRGTPWETLAQGELMRQGFLVASREKVVRVRIEGKQAWLTIKGRTEGMVRAEWEYPIPLADAHELLALCEQPLIEKHRYRIRFADKLWELDVFEGENAGLVVAEIELDSIGEHFERPDWLGDEVTNDPRYLNVNLQRQPYSGWKTPS